MADTNSFNVLQILAGFVASGAGTLLAAYVGIRFGLKKLRRERAFEKQLEWYETLGRTIFVLHNRQNSLRVFLREKTPGIDVGALIEELASLSFQFQELATMAEMYAPEETCRVVLDGLSEMNRLGATSFAPAGGASDDMNASTAAMEQSIRILRTIGGCIARDMRGHLGLKSLSEHAALPTSSSTSQLGT
jgi:hypothetical protein